MLCVPELENVDPKMRRQNLAHDDNAHSVFVSRSSPFHEMLFHQILLSGRVIRHRTDRNAARKSMNRYSLSAKDTLLSTLAHRIYIVVVCGAYRLFMVFNYWRHGNRLVDRSLHERCIFVFHFWWVVAASSYGEHGERVWLWPTLCVWWLIYLRALILSKTATRRRNYGVQFDYNIDEHTNSEVIWVCSIGCQNAIFLAEIQSRN